MAKITVHTQDGEARVYEGGNVKTQIGPGVLVIVDFDRPLGLFNLEFVNWAEIAE